MSTHRHSPAGRPDRSRDVHGRAQAGSWASTLDRDLSTRTPADLREEISTILSRAVLRVLLPAIGFPPSDASESGSPAFRGATASDDEIASAQTRSIAVNTLDSRAIRLEVVERLEASCPAYVTTEATR